MTPNLITSHKMLTCQTPQTAPPPIPSNEFKLFLSFNSDAIPFPKTFIMHHFQYLSPKNLNLALSSHIRKLFQIQSHLIVLPFPSNLPFLTSTTLLRIHPTTFSRLLANTHPNTNCAKSVWTDDQFAWRCVQIAQRFRLSLRHNLDVIRTTKRRYEQLCRWVAELTCPFHAHHQWQQCKGSPLNEFNIVIRNWKRSVLWPYLRNSKPKESNEAICALATDAHVFPTLHNALVSQNTDSAWKRVRDLQCVLWTSRKGWVRLSWRSRI